MTGGGFGTRKLYTDAEEILFDAMRPVILNGIEFVTKSDMADRLIFFKLPPIKDQERQPEEQFWKAFERKRPAILGALLDVVAYGLKALPNTAADESYPRMADYVRWSRACEGALWKAGTFDEAYANNRAKANLDVIEGETIANAIIRLLKKQDEWSGTARALLDRLEEVVGDKEAKRKHWPGSAAALGARLRRITSRLARVGIKVVFMRKGVTRTIKLKRAEPEKQDLQSAVIAVTLSQRSKNQKDSNDSDHDSTDKDHTSTVIAAVTGKSLNNRENDSDDSNDSDLQANKKPRFRYQQPDPESLRRRVERASVKRRKPD